MDWTLGEDSSRSITFNWWQGRRPCCEEHCPWEEQKVSPMCRIESKNWKSWWENTKNTKVHISRNVQETEINGHLPRRRRETIDSGIHEHKAKLRVAQEKSVSVGAVESQRKVCNGLLARWQWRRSGLSKRADEWAWRQFNLVQSG